MCELCKGIIGTDGPQGSKGNQVSMVTFIKMIFNACNIFMCHWHYDMYYKYTLQISVCVWVIARRCCSGSSWRDWATGSTGKSRSRGSVPTQRYIRWKGCTLSCKYTAAISAATKSFDHLNACQAHFLVALHEATTTLDFERVSDFPCMSGSSYKVMHTLWIMLPYTELQFQSCSSLVTLKLIGLMFLSRGCRVLKVPLDYQEKR